MKASCRRWVALEDRRAIGESLSKTEEIFSVKHATECEACAREAALWKRFAEFDSGEERGGEGKPSPNVVEQIVRRHQQSLRAGEAVVALEPRFGPARRTVAVAAVAALALAAAIFLLLRRGSEPPVAALGVVHGVVSAGDSEIDGKRAGAGDSFLAGQAIRARDRVCLDLELAVEACLEPGSEATFEDAATVHRVVRLQRGHLTATLGHQPAGTSFSVSTRSGTATAVGTSFTVDVPDPSGPVRVRVTTGIVAVVAPGSADVRVHGGEETVMGTSVVTSFESAEGGSVAPPALPAAGTPSPPLPPAVPRPLAPPPSPPRAPGADELLQRARALRGGGRFREAAEVYEELEAVHPDSAEARASLVSLGEVELSQLGDPERALRAFDEYLTSGGVLAEEAAYDRILALRALGRAGEERAATESFVSRYPSSLHTPTLQSRLRREDAAP